jgi:hypothetical protein
MIASKKPASRMRNKETIQIPIRSAARCTASVTVAEFPGNKNPWWAVYSYNSEGGYGGMICGDPEASAVKCKCATREGAIMKAVHELEGDLLRKSAAPHVGHASLSKTATALAAKAAEDVRRFYENRGKTEKPSIYAPKGKRVEDLDREINDFVEKRTGQKNVVDRKRDGSSGGTALVPVAAAAVSAIDAPLDAAERRQLATAEKTIERNAAAVFEVGEALRTIRDGRLYRATHSEFGAYCIDRWGFTKSYGHRQIEAATKHQAAAPIAAKLGIDLNNECQMRALSKLDDADLPNVMRRVARLVPAGDDGRRRVTAEILSRAVKEETTSPDDLKRDAARRKEVARDAETRRRGDAEKDGLQEPTPEMAVRSPAAEMAVGSSEAQADRLNFQDALPWLREYVEQLFANFPLLSQKIALSGLLKYLSKKAMDIHACQVCGCSETDPCDDDDELDGDEPICSGCARAGRGDLRHFGVIAEAHHG